MADTARQVPFKLAQTVSEALNYRGVEKLLRLGRTIEGPEEFRGGNERRLIINFSVHEECNPQN